MGSILIVISFFLTCSIIYLVTVFHENDSRASGKMSPVDDALRSHGTNNTKPSLLGNYTKYMSGRKAVVLTSTNAAFLDMTYNLLESIRRLGALPYIAIVAEDEAAYNSLKDIPDVEISLADRQSSSQKLQILINSKLTREYNLLTHKRPEHILRYLSKGFDVLWTDADSVWLQNPFPYFTGDDLDVFISVDPVTRPGTERPIDRICTGFMYFKCNNNTIKLMENWIEDCSRLNGSHHDQYSFKRLIKASKNKNIKIQTLNDTQFVPGRGKNYFDANWRKEHPEYKPVVLHNSYAFGHDKKVLRFRNMGMWYI